LQPFPVSERPRSARPVVWAVMTGFDGLGKHSFL
jgi:hypothetical protein